MAFLRSTAVGMEASRRARWFERLLADLNLAASLAELEIIC